MTFRVLYIGSPISSLSALGATLDCDPALLSRVADNISDYYTSFQIAKKNGEMREIRAPKPVLKTIQRRINSRIFSHCQFPLYLQGSIKDSLNPRDFVSNAQTHAKSKTVISADIRSFFPSVQQRFVKETFKYFFQFPDGVAKTLASLTTLDGALPQGAPTSSYLANLVFYDVEHKMVGEFSRANLIYTRLIDDITVSSVAVLDKKKKEWIVGKIRHMLTTKDLTLHSGKLRMESTGSVGTQVIVTGLWIDRGHPRLSSKDRNLVRAMVHNRKKEYEAGHKTTVEFHEDHNSTSGKVALMSRLGHAQASTLRNVLRAHQPEYSKESRKKLTKICRQFAGRKGHGSDRAAYTTRYHRLMHCLSILGRSDALQARRLRFVLNRYPPKHRVSDFLEE